MKFFFFFVFSLVLSTVWAFKLSAEEPTGRITHGQDTDADQFPFIVQLAVDSHVVCGGSLIGRNWILTAAHCVHGEKSVTVYLGVIYQTGKCCTVREEDITVHADYNPETLQYDVALINIPTNDMFAAIRTVSLPKFSPVYATYAGDSALASGWGDIKDSGRSASHLQWARMPIISNEVCARMASEISENRLCVDTSSQVSTCDGDSGGPLILESTGELIGVTSAVSFMGCEAGMPALFNRVTFYLEWIKDKTGIWY